MKKIYILSLIIIVNILLLTGCNEIEPGLMQQEGDSMFFTGSVYENSELNTRSDPFVHYLYNEDYDGNFYIDLITEGIHKCRTYRVPETKGREGHLVSYANKDSLIWQSKYDAHTFYSWTMPWKESDPYIKDDGTVDENIETKISFLQNDPMYNITDEETGLTINTYESSLENFIGAKAGPLSYSENGEFINLQFQHLVSKIHLNNIRYTHTDQEGNQINQRVDGVITFIGMPAEGLFIRNGEGRPEVIPIEGSNQASYYFSKTNFPTTIYVCPDVDFSKVKFRITSTSDDVTDDAGDFLGDFSAVTFARDESDWWDIEHPDNKTLYAGEELTLNITLRQGIGTDISLGISGWKTQGVREASDYPYNGIYNESQWNDIHNTLGRNGNYDGQEKIEEEICQRYGDPETHELFLYTDINGISQRVVTGKNHVLNGLGHTLSFSRYYPTQNATTTEQKYVRISRMKDVFLEGPDGCKLYIDENFRIFKLSEDGTMTDTGNSLEPLKDNMSSYEINLETGEIIRQYSGK